MAKSTTGYASKPLGPGADRFMLQPFSRYTNASRFAGETDGLEAIESVAKAYPIDRNRIVMTGFSMGGAAAWSFIVHYADRWAAAAPGAGFSETAVFLRGALASQPQNAVQQTLWHMYDSTDYAANTFNLPVVAYSGGIDAQKQAADAMAAAMLQEGLALEHVIGPETGHAYEPHARQQVQDRLDQLVGHGQESRAEGDSLHDVDAALQPDVLGDGRCDGVPVAAGPGRRAPRGPRHQSDDRERHRPAPGVRAGPRAVSCRHVAVGHHRRRVGHAAAGRARRFALRQPDQGGSRLETRGTAERRAPQDARAAGPDRRRVHGQLHVRAAERDAAVAGAGPVGRRTGGLRRQRMGALLPRRAARQARYRGRRRRHRGAQPRALRRPVEQRRLQAHRRPSPDSMERRRLWSSAARPIRRIAHPSSSSRTR